MGSEHWAKATVAAFNKLVTDECAEVAKPEWWNDKELKAMSARVVRAAPDELAARKMRADVLLSGSMTAGRRGRARRRILRRRPRTLIGLWRCALLRWGKPATPVTRPRAAVRQAPCSGVMSDHPSAERVACVKRVHRRAWCSTGAPLTLTHTKPGKGSPGGRRRTTRHTARADRSRF